MSKIKIIDPNFNQVVIGLLSPEDILSRSSGEITEPETKNHRTYKAEPGGLFGQDIFGPEENYKCSCGKYKSIKYKGTVCDRCNVEVNEKSVRRRRMAHITLATKVLHPLYNLSHPNFCAAVLGYSNKELQNIRLRSLMAVIEPGVKKKEGMKLGDLLTPREYAKIIAALPTKSKLPANQSRDTFIAMSGVEAIDALLSRTDLDVRAREERDKVVNETSQQRRAEATKRLLIIESFRKASKNGKPNKPVWMIIKYLPVISPAYRPVFPLESGRFITSDITRIYQIIITRNKRLKKLIEMRAPSVIVNNEELMLQEGVNGLMDNSSGVNDLKTIGQRPLKSISDHMKGKRGFVRHKMLGKRVDFSGRSVIVAGPELKLNECGLPKNMALVLFEPYIIHRLYRRGLIKTFKEGKQMIEEKPPVVWSILASVIKGHPVLLNRQPTLHRLGIQAFYVVLVEGNAIRLHPLCCTAFNADHDGDTMCVLLPMTTLAIAEARHLMLSSKNLLNPSNGNPIVYPTKGMIFGLYHLTKKIEKVPGKPLKGEGIFFSGLEEVLIAINTGKLSKHAHIKVRIEDESQTPRVLDTVAGRVIFNQCVPKELGFINEEITNKTILRIVREAILKIGMERTSVFLDEVKELGFHQTHVGGLTFGLDDIRGPSNKGEMLQEAERKVAACNEKYYMGLLTDNERYNKIIDIWTVVSNEFTELTLRELETHKNGHNTLWCMYKSGARGSRDQMKQLCGMKGLMGKTTKTSGNRTIIERPIKSSVNGGLTVAEFFINTFGSREGMAASALKAAETGYFSRKLIDVAQNVVITQEKCNTLRGRTITPIYVNSRLRYSIGSQIVGRVPVTDILEPQSQKVIIQRGQIITEAIAKKIDDLKLRSIKICSPAYCDSQQGICAWCYGINLGSNKPSQIGDSAGNVAAQSIGEPGTQMVLRIFQKGGAAAGNIVDEIVKALEPGIVRIDNLKSVVLDNKTIVINRSAEIKVFDAKTNQEIQGYVLPYGSTVLVESGSKVESGQGLFELDIYKIPILTHVAGTVVFDSLEKGVTYKEEYSRETGIKGKIIIESQERGKEPKILVDDGNGNRTPYMLPPTAQIVVEEGDKVKPGAILAKISRPKNTPKDIAGGLPQVTKLFEMQKIINKAVISLIDGYVSIGTHRRGKLEIEVKAKTGLKEVYKVPQGRQVLVQDGDYVKAGGLISDGLLAAEDILKYGGPDHFVYHMILSVQDVYRQQGIVINDKHIEVILRQMLQKVRIVSFGDTLFVPTQVVSKIEFARVNETLKNKKIVVDAGDSPFKEGDLISVHQVDVENKILQQKNKKLATVRDPQPAVAELIAQGITNASMSSDSFISAASFQETVKTLVSAAIEGKTDPIKGVKESVICSKPIPAGTGMKRYNGLKVICQEVQESLAEKNYSI
ncbi:MAG: DNA-directed RNA polymerase subunit beta' [Cytophagales bacterium]